MTWRADRWQEGCLPKLSRLCWYSQVWCEAAGDIRSSEKLWGNSAPAWRRNRDIGNLWIVITEGMLVRGYNVEQSSPILSKLQSNPIPIYSRFSDQNSLNMLCVCFKLLFKNVWREYEIDGQYWEDCRGWRSHHRLLQFALLSPGGGHLNTTTATAYATTAATAAEVSPEGGNNIESGKLWWKQLSTSYLSADLANCDCHQ